MKDVIVIGSGIAGLSCGLELEKENIDFQILEEKDRTGGAIESVRFNDFLVETGPHAFSSNSKEILDIVKDLGIENLLLEAKTESNKRYIFLNNNLVPLPRNPFELYKTDLLSKDGKYTILEELFIPREDKEETVEQFISRRFGREVLKNVIQPYLAGVFGGDVIKLSANAVFPELKDLEKKYKSIILGYFLSGKFKKSKMSFYSFKEGMETLTRSISNKLKNKITLNVSNLQVTRAKDYFIVSYKVNNKQLNYTTNAVLFATPAYKVLNYPHLFPSKKYMEIFETEYIPMAVVSQAVDKSKVGTNMDGFGFLCAYEPRRKLLGTMWDSVVFPGRSPANKTILTSFIGGTYHKKIVEQSKDEIIGQVSKEVAEIMWIANKDDLETIHIKVHEHAIPQFYKGHLEKVRNLEDMMNKNFGLFFTGNYLYGISVNDTIKTTKKVVNKIKNFLNVARDSESRSGKKAEKELVTP